MCKKVISFIFALILFITSISQVKAYDPDIDAGSRMKYDRDESREETYFYKVRKEKKGEVFEQWRIGIDSILFGKIKRDMEGRPLKLIGITFLGVGYRGYFLRDESLRGPHVYWELGVNYFIFPYGGIGVNFEFPTGGSKIGKTGVFSLGFGVNCYTAYIVYEGYSFLPYVFPYISVSYSF